MDSKQRAISDFRDKTLWIYLVMFATFAVVDWHRQPVLSWIAIMALAVLLPVAVHFQFKKRDVRLVEEGKG